jgi:hypothetical protein
MSKTIEYKKNEGLLSVETSGILKLRYESEKAPLAYEESLDLLKLNLEEREE